MTIAIACILSAWLGAGIGFFACALCVAAKKADDWELAVVRVRDREGKR
jgi:hypothetical protein